MSYDTRLEETRVWFLKVAEETLGQALFEQVSGELFLRSRTIAVSILSAPPEYHLCTAKRQLRKHVTLIKRAENDPLNRQKPTERGIKMHLGLACSTSEDHHPTARELYVTDDDRRQEEEPDFDD